MKSSDKEVTNEKQYQKLEIIVETRIIAHWLTATKQLLIQTINPDKVYLRTAKAKDIVQQHKIYK